MSYLNRFLGRKEVLFVGEAPLKDGTTAFDPDTNSGGRLLKHLGWSRETWDAYADSINLFGKPVDIWEEDLATRNARTLLNSGLLDYRTAVVLCGRKVGDAFELPGIPWMVGQRSVAANSEVFIVSHPSGRSRWWNDANNRHSFERWASDVQKFAADAENLIPVVGIQHTDENDRSTFVRDLELGNVTVTISMTDAVKRMVRDAFDFPYDALWGWGTDSVQAPGFGNDALTLRRILRATYHEYDDLCPNVWVHRLLRSMDAVTHGADYEPLLSQDEWVQTKVRPDIIVVPDLGRPQSVEALRKIDACVVTIKNNCVYVDGTLPPTIVDTLTQAGYRVTSVTNTTSD